MNPNIDKYLRNIEGEKLRPGFECNSITANLLKLLHPEVKSDLHIIIKDLKNCNNLNQIRKVIRNDNRTARKYLELYGYKPTDSVRILKGDFLIKPRRYFDDCVFMVDSNTKVGVAPNLSGDHKTAIIRIDKKIQISNKHIIYRR